MGNYYSYKRISTDANKQNFNRQTKALEKYAADQRIEYLVDFIEEKSAKSIHELPQLRRLDKILQTGDTVVFKDLSRFTRDAIGGYEVYMNWMQRGINIVFLDNPTVSSEYIRQMMQTAENQDIVTRTAMEGIIKLLIIVELDRCEQQRRYISKAITDGIAASHNVSGRKKGHLDKMTDALEKDIKLYLQDRHITISSLMSKHHLSRNTIKKYIDIVKKK